MSSTFLELIRNRRSYYALNDDLPISQKRVQEIVTEALLHTPSAFNSQSTRLLVLFNQEHKRLWQIARDILKKRVTEEQWKRTGPKLSGFEAAAGTVSTRSSFAPVGTVALY
jgi:predicted oxidoreductase (fatty acid repression mutant protein)